jgi:hypothetical protein
MEEFTEEFEGAATVGDEPIDTKQIYKDAAKEAAKATGKAAGKAALAGAQGFKNLLNGIDRGFLVRSYFFSAILWLFFFIGFSDMPGGGTGMQVYATICAILFPFADVLWNDLTHFLTGGGLNLFWSIKGFFIWKIVKLVLLFTFAPLIAPIGMIYIAWGNKRS